MKKCFLLILALISCSSALASKERISQNLVAGIIGCPASSIAISNYSSSSKNPFINSAHTFTATCNNIKYYCSYLYPSPATCKEAVEVIPKTAVQVDEEQIESWKTAVLSKAIKNWKAPESLNGMVDSQIAVKVDSNGKLLNLRWVKPTGIKEIDSSIVKAFKNAAPFSAPPISAPTFTRVITFPAHQ